MNDEIVHFVIGSSLFITIFPLLYLYTAFDRLTETEKRKSRISFNLLSICLPIAFGLGFAMMYRLLSGVIPRKTGDIYTRFIVCGAINALFISLILEHILSIYTDWLKVPNPLLCHLCITLFYLIVFYTLGTWIRAQILYGPQPTSSSSSYSSYSQPSPSYQPSSSPSSSPSIPKSDSAASDYFDALKSKVTTKES
jgi:nitrate/nitrite transporter NarK